jgi:DNA-binding response OmpR family regulator
MKKRILIVEDDAPLVRILADNFTFEGFDVRYAGDGHSAINVASSFAPDLVVLDLNLPDVSGLELCRIWREELRIPMIILTARGRKEDKVRGLRLGADDYVTKPFDLEELMARVHAVLRRARPLVDRLTLGAVTVDFVRKEASSRGRAIELSHREFSLLRYLAERADSVVHRDELLRELWRFPDSSHTRAVDHAIVRLRRKIEPDPHHPRFIRTAHGGGYLLACATGSRSGDASGRDEPAEDDL